MEMFCGSQMFERFVQERIHDSEISDFDRRVANEQADLVAWSAIYGNEDSQPQTLEDIFGKRASNIGKPNLFQSLRRGVLGKQQGPQGSMEVPTLEPTMGMTSFSTAPQPASPVVAQPAAPPKPVPMVAPKKPLPRPPGAGGPQGATRDDSPPVVDPEGADPSAPVTVATPPTGGMPARGGGATASVRGRGRGAPANGGRGSSAAARAALPPPPGPPGAASSNNNNSSAGGSPGAGAGAVPGPPLPSRRGGNKPPEDRIMRPAHSMPVLPEDVSRNQVQSVIFTKNASSLDVTDDKPRAFSTIASPISVAEKHVGRGRGGAAGGAPMRRAPTPAEMAAAAASGGPSPMLPPTTPAPAPPVAERPPAERPPAERPPAERPPAERPPAERPTGGAAGTGGVHTTPPRAPMPLPGAAAGGAGGAGAGAGAGGAGGRKPDRPTRVPTMVVPATGGATGPSHVVGPAAAAAAVAAAAAAAVAAANNNSGGGGGGGGGSNGTRVLPPTPQKGRASTLQDSDTSSSSPSPSPPVALRPPGRPPGAPPKRGGPRRPSEIEAE